MVEKNKMENLENNNSENQENKETDNENNNKEEKSTENSGNEQNSKKKVQAADLILKQLKKIKQGDYKDLRKIGQEIENSKSESKQVSDLQEDDKEEEKKQNNKKDDNPNFNKYSRKELVEEFQQLLNKPFDEIKEQAEIIKNIFYKKRNSEIYEKKQKFVDEGGNPDEFKPDTDQIDENFKNAYNKFRELKQQRNEQIEAEQQRNLNLKYQIIDKIEELIKKGETLNKTFDEFHALRDEWNKIGPVDQSEAKTLLEKYNFTLQKFYDWVKINKELRDFDLKRNLEQKIKLCEEAELLLLEPKIVKAYKKLQDLHQRWREIGPVPKEQKENVWNRFKESSSIINKRHYEYFQDIKKRQQDNLKAKELLCEEAEKIAEKDYKSSKQWRIKTGEINELMKLWRLIGFAPKKYNNQIFERFISARKNFFEKKHKFYQKFTEILEKNLQLKEGLIVEAENAKDNTDWKKTSNFFIKLQERWKEIGPVPRSKKDEIWKKFNSICDYFFDKKREYFKNKKLKEEENLKLKNKLIEDINNAKLDDTPENNLKTLQNFQKKWSEIGFVPFKNKDEIYDKYKKAIDEKFKNLDIDQNKRKKIEYKQKIKKIKSSNKSSDKLRDEIDKVKNQIDTLNNEIITLENNLSFFVKSKNSEQLLDNLKTKLKNLKEKKQTQQDLLVELSKAYKQSQK